MEAINVGNQLLLVFVLTVELQVFDFVGALVSSVDLEVVVDLDLLQILLGEVLEVSLGEGDGNADDDPLVLAGDLDGLPEFAGLAVDFYPLLEELCEVGGVENLVLDGFGAVDHE